MVKAKDKMAVAHKTPLSPCDSCIIHCSFISPPQCQYSSVSSILKVNKWNSLAPLVFAPSAVNAPCPWSVMVLETAALKDWFIQKHTRWLTCYRAPLYFTLGNHDDYSSTYRENTAFTQHPFPLFIQYKLVYKHLPKFLMFSTKHLTFWLVLNSLSFVYVHNTLTNIHLEQRKLNEHSAYVQIA